MQAMIELQNVTKVFGKTRAVDGLTMRIARGEIFGFLGPNGAGKTTTIKMLCGLLRPTAGQLFIGGADPLLGGPDVRRRIAYIPDTPFLYDRLTAAEFFEFTGRLYGTPPRRIEAAREQAFAHFDLTDAADVLIKDFSHGMRQRLIYATTFARDPEVYFVDEPFIGLDPRGIRLIKGLLRERARGGAAVFLTTHILALIEDLVDRVGILQRGRLIASGTLSELRGGSSKQRLEDVFLDLTEGNPCPSPPNQSVN